MILTNTINNEIYHIGHIEQSKKYRTYKNVVMTQKLHDEVFKLGSTFNGEYIEQTSCALDYGEILKCDIKVLRNDYKNDWSELNIDMLDSLEYSMLPYTEKLKHVSLNKIAKVIPFEVYKTESLRVYFNDKKKATTLINGNKVTVVKCGKGDKYNKRIGFLEAYFQSMSGLTKTQARKYLDKLLKESELNDK
jgi:hypothetical protein